MKKILAILLVLVTLSLLIAGCAGQDAAVPAEPEKQEEAAPASSKADDLKTFADVVDLQPEEYDFMSLDDQILYAFSLDGVYYRAKAALDSETSAALINLEFDDPDYDAKQKEILGRIRIEELEDLSSRMLTEDQLKAVAGKTGQELLDEGWNIYGSYSLIDMEFEWSYGPFKYNVCFDGKVEEADWDSFDPYESLPGMTAKSASFIGLGAADFDVVWD